MAMRIAVIGGGIAGVSAASALAARGCQVTVLEREAMLAYHTSGRSAAAFLESYGNAHIRALTRAARPLLRDSELTPRPFLSVAGPDDAGAIDAEMAGNPALRRLSVAQAVAACPVLRPQWLSAAAVEPTACDLDVAALFDRFRQQAVAAGVAIRTRTALAGADRAGSGWRLALDDGEAVEADAVVNAAGAWADQVASMLGAAALGLVALRRTAAVASLRVPDPSARSWPLVADVAEGFYFRPEGDGLLVSPSEETPSEPCDAKPDYEDVALALYRINEATTLDLRHVRASWAGLRTFAPDRTPVAGPDPAVPDVFWLAGQGGYGMQTAGALALVVAAAVTGTPLPPGLVAEGVDAGALAPARFSAASS
jgi:D-arginine dehydrogenase